MMTNSKGALKLNNLIMKNIAVITVLLILFSCGFAKSNELGGQPVSHSLFDELLHKYVARDGFVDYQGFRTFNN